MSRISVLAFSGDSRELSRHSDPEIQWAMSLESTKHHHFNTTANKPTIFNSQHISPDASVDPILIGIIEKTSRHQSVNHIRHLLAQNASCPSSESWLEAALSSLQKAEIIPKFSIVQFRAHAYEAIRNHVLDDVSEALTIDYSALMKQCEGTKTMLDYQRYGEHQKQGVSKSYLGFRVARPVLQNSAKREIMGFERRDDPYGGLM